jgi:2-polyprenyl-3-methyl-5-hydroxy-6-metoxy-1,4-benzoquinol methylase
MIRAAPAVRTTTRLRATLKGWLRRSQRHDDIYDAEYFAMVERTSSASAEIMAASLAEHLAPRSAIDFGCGTGSLISGLRDLGVKVTGTEIARAALEHCRRKELDVVEMDFADPATMTEPIGTFDLAISLEVAHQLDGSAARNLLATMCRHADTILFTAAPCARDRLPRTPREPDYWIACFADHSFKLDEAISETLRAEWEHKGTAPWFHRRPMIFRRELQA